MCLLMGTENEDKMMELIYYSYLISLDTLIYYIYSTKAAITPEAVHEMIQSVLSVMDLLDRDRARHFLI
jgi:hypothetical protein